MSFQFTQDQQKDQMLKFQAQKSRSLTGERLLCECYLVRISPLTHSSFRKIHYIENYVVACYVMHFLLQKPDYMIRHDSVIFKQSFSLKFINTIQYSAYYAEAIKLSFANFFI